MKAINITISPFELVEILDVEISKCINQHGSAWVKGIIDEEAEDMYVGMSLSEVSVTITASDYDGSKQALFQGVLEDMKISVENGLNIIELSIMPYSRILDLVQENRVFQDPNITYNRLVKSTLAPYSEAYALINAGDGQAIGQMFVQYQETAWTFLKRMASMNNDVVVPNDTLSGVWLYFGFPNKHATNTSPLSPISYSMKKNVSDYIYKRDNNVLSVSEYDSVCYIVKDREVR